MQCGPVDALILPVQPAGQGTPYIINTCDLSGTEKIFLNKSYGILDRTLTFRIGLIAHPELQILFGAEIFKNTGLIAHPELQILFGAEIFKNTGLNDFAVGLTGDEHRILIDDQDRRSPPELAEAPVDCLTGFFSVIFMVLSINAQEP